ncbi:MAG: AAA family ATPase [Chitinophagaceae bacterium]|nr:AAA family ATPase [Chitinophagaceae bacterium]
MQPIKKIVVIGPESTGKSTLCEQLAQHYKTEWCAEFAREYLLTYGTNYEASDLTTIAKGQIALEEEWLQKVNKPWNSEHGPWKNDTPILFIDTDMYVMKVWSEYVFGVCDFFILDAINKRQYDHYLLCNIDLPWVKDELREYPNEQPRKELFYMYKDLLINQSVPWTLISGDYDERLVKAIEVVDQLV